MSIDNGGPAFPRAKTVQCYEYEGMTLRDYFAVVAYRIADAMIAERKGQDDE
jgi:hypothetical protein